MSEGNFRWAAIMASGWVFLGVFDMTSQQWEFGLAAIVCFMVCILDSFGFGQDRT
jgi:hypothetical protein